MYGIINNIMYGAIFLKQYNNKLVKTAHVKKFSENF